MWAALRGHGGVVKMLLAHEEVDPSNPDGLGQTPLWYAAKNGHERVVAVLQPLTPTIYGAV